jgi:hypothetical protein
MYSHISSVSILSLLLFFPSCCPVTPPYGRTVLNENTVNFHPPLPHSGGGVLNQAPPSHQVPCRIPTACLQAGANLLGLLGPPPPPGHLIKLHPPIKCHAGCLLADANLLGLIGPPQPPALSWFNLLSPPPLLALSCLSRGMFLGPSSTLPGPHSQSSPALARPGASQQMPHLDKSPDR